MKDLVVIGAGMAGNAAARKCATAGWDVAIIDEFPYGGTCALRGCDPKKMLRRAAEIMDAAQLMQGKGIDQQGLKVNWADLMAHKRSFTDDVPAKMEAGLQSAGVETFHGHVRFISPHKVELESGQTLEAKYFLIATGAKPRPLPVPGEEFLTDSTAFLELEKLPKRILFVGGGYISFEFAHIAARAGATTTIISRGEKVLKQFDPDLVGMLISRSREAGIRIATSTSLSAIEKFGDVYRVHMNQNGQEQTDEYDLVVHGAGRVAATDHLGLEEAGIESSEKGIAVTPWLQSTTQPHVFAAGDAAATKGKPLTPVAVSEGKVAASNLLKGTTTAPDYTGIPSAVFTVPELVSVGMSEAEAREKVGNLRVAYTDTSGWFSNRRVGETHAAAKILIDEESDLIVGAHLFGPEYGELVNYFGLAMKTGLTTRQLKSMSAAYPSVSSDLGGLLA